MKIPENEGIILKIPEYERAGYLVDMVIKKDSPSCTLVSEGGLGKSFLVRTMLEQQKKKDEYVIHSGHITPLGLYKLMYENSEKIIVLDDVEEVLKSDVSVGILKAGLWDVKGDGKRDITWATTSEKLGDTPQRFTFNGGIILLCNKIPRKYDAIVSALRTRGLEYEIKLTYNQKLRIFKQLIDEQDFSNVAGFKLTAPDKNRLKKDLEKNTSTVLKNFNFRTVIKLIKYFVYNKINHPNKPGLYLELHKATTKVDEDKELVYQMMKSKLPVSQQVQNFTAKTGRSRETYYRIKKQLDIDIPKNKTRQEKNHTTKSTEPLKQMDKKTDEHNVKEYLVINDDLMKGLINYNLKRESKLKTKNENGVSKLYMMDELVATISKRKDGMLKVNYKENDSIKYKIVNGEKDFHKIYVEIKERIDIVTKRNSLDKFW